MAQKLFDKASLVMIPSQYKEGKMYNIKPEDQSSAFEFERGSAATRVNSDGLIETLHGEATNLLLQSNNFDTTWTPTSSTVTSGQTGYDGSNDAWLLEATGAASRIIQNNTTSGVQTFSCYAKAGTANYLAFYNIVSGLAPRAWFNLSNGTIENSFHNIDANIESVGSGWYRCSLTYNDTLSNARIYVADAAGDFATSLGDNIYIQDAQLETGYFATPYIETTTEAVTRPNRHDTPRLDYSGTEPALLLEPQRTNELSYSEDFGGFTERNNSTTTSNASVSPDGLQNATKLQGVGDWRLRELVSSTIGNTATVSVWVKAVNENEKNQFVISIGGGSNSSVFTATSQWQRFEFTKENIAGGFCGITDYLNQDSDLYVWGMQVEQGSYATSYIPTNGQTETRLADVCQGGGDASVFNDSEGVLYVEAKALQEGGINRNISITDGTSNNYIWLRYDATSGRFQAFLRSGGGANTSLSSIGNTQLNNNKIALVYKSSEFSMWLNGTKVDIDTPTATPIGLNKCSFDLTGGGSFQGEVKALHYFPEVLTDTELQQLTSNT